MPKKAIISVFLLALVLMGVGCNEVVQEKKIENNVASTSSSSFVSQEIINETTSTEVVESSGSIQNMYFQKDGKTYYRNEQGEVEPFYFTEDGAVHLTVKAGEDIVLTQTYEEQPVDINFARISPNRKYLVYAAFIGDGGEAKMYDVETKNTYDLMFISGVTGTEWLADNRLRAYSGCIVQTYCKVYESETAAKPWVLVLVEDLSVKESGSTVNVSTNTVSEFKPEIPVNEYWDYGTLNGLKLYVNNTDKGVIYALDPKGKIVWTIWGKDYGFKQYEIRMIDNNLFITNFTYDGYGSYRLWVFNQDGKLLWSQGFSGYLDMPQMRISGTNVFLNSRDREGAVLTSIEINTGRILWKLSDGYYGGYLEDQGETLRSWSGGVGLGRFGYEYIIDKKTGKVVTYSIKVNDREYGQDKKDLVFLPNEQVIEFRPSFSKTVIWSLPKTAPLYDLVSKHLLGDLRIVVLNDIILIQELSANGMINYAFSKQDGSFLWEKNHEVAGYYAVKTVDHNRMLFLLVDCGKACTLPEKYKNSIGAYNTELWGINEINGEVMWKYKKPLTWLKSIDEKTGDVIIDTREDGKGFEMVLYPITGEIKRKTQTYPVENK